MDISIFYPIISFWITYGIGLLIFPKGDAITRIDISSLELIRAHMLNIIYSVSIIPLTTHIPILYNFNNNLTWYDILLKYSIAILTVEFWFYYVHYALHTKMLYRFHKTHHCYIQSNIYASLYCSPVEMVFLNQLSILIPLKIYGFSMEETIIISMFVAINVIKGHATLHLLRIMPAYIPVLWYQNWDHDSHHRLLRYNYGILSLLDRLHGTRYEKKRCI